MKYAVIELSKKNHEMREKSIKLYTVFGNVFAPLSKCVVKNNVAWVPTWVFYKAEMNPCQMVSGWVGNTDKTKTTPAELKARKTIAGLSTKGLVEQFEITESVPMEPAVPVLRGWLMDELQKRDAQAFDKWIDSLEDSPRRFYL